MANTLNVGNGGTYTTIQAAIDAASEGDTIVVAAGDYAENLVITKNGITLEGAPGRATTIRPGSSDATDGNLITVRADGVTIRGFTLDGANAALDAGSSGVVLPDGVETHAARIVSNYKDSLGGGFATDGLTVVDNAILHGQRFGVAIANQNASRSGGNLIENNDFSGMAGIATSGSYRIGVLLSTEGYADIKNNRMVDVGEGIQASTLGQGDPDGTPLEISGNVISAQRGIMVNNIYTSASDVIVTGNTLSYGATVAGSAANHIGIRIWSVYNGGSAAFDGNNISGFNYGYRASNNLEEISIKGGTLSGNNIGVELWENYPFGLSGPEFGSENRVVLQGVNFTGSKVANVRVDDSDTGKGGVNQTMKVVFDSANPPVMGDAPVDVLLIGDTAAFVPNGFDGDLVIKGDGAANEASGGDGNDLIEGEGGNDQLTGGGGNDTLKGGADADTANYSGARSGYNVTTSTNQNGERVITVTDTDLSNGNEGTDTLTGIETLSFAGSQVDVDERVQLFDQNGNLVGTFDTIQAAENAASNGFTIQLAAGSYDEDVTIDVGVKILGAQAGTSATGRDAASAAGASNILGNITVSSQSNVTIDGVRIVNDTLGSPPSLDILASAGDIVLTNSVIFSTVAGASTGDFAIAVRPSAGGTVTVTNNQISGTSTNQFGSANFQSGLFFDGGGRGLTFTGNLVDKGRTGINLDAAGTSTANVSDNDFRSVGSAITVGVNANLAGLTIANNDVQNVGSEFSFRNLTRGVTFDAGAALDVLTPAGNPNDLIAVLGGSGGDNFTGSEFADLLDGNFNSATATDADVLKGLAGNDQLFGRGGDDSLTGGTGNDTLDGGANIDTAFFSGARIGYSVARNSTTGVVTVTDIDMTDGDEGTDTLTNVEFLNFDGTNFDSTQNETRVGSGNQAVNGGEGSDIFFVGSGNDTVNGNGGDDDLYGESGSDTLNGGDGNDELFGGSGTDTMNGGAGNDDLDGGSGNDRMSGGSGDDDFIFQSGNGYDTVTDFQVGSDQILVDGITIRSVTYKNVGGGAALDTIVTFGSGGGSVTLLDTGNLGDNGQARITAENGNPNSTPSSAPPASFATSQSLAGPSGLAFTDLVL